MSGPGLQAVHAVGGLMPPGLLARIQAGELNDRAGLAPSTYHLAGRETVRDAASRAWSYLRGAWTAWREYAAAQPPGTTGSGPARERWLLVLLRELGYGQVPPLPAGVIVDGREYPVSHAWQHVPIHLLGPGVDLDRGNPRVAGAARAPQAMVQELLNRADTQRWAIVSNGLRLRLLRDSSALAGSAYLEFDLEAIFDGELYPEFLLMWQLSHVSRLEKRGPDSTPADCWLEAWRGEAIEAGTRMLDRLRTGVAAALIALGTGFLHHPDNRTLVKALHDGKLSIRDYHRALLRLVYRLLFCFVAEDRDALLHPDASAGARDRYRRFFSTARLRRLSRIRGGGPHGDLWQAQRLVLRALGNHGDDRIGLPGLAGIFDPDHRMPDIEELGAEPLLGSSLANEDLLTAVRHLGWLPGERIQPVDYRNLGAEELGSVYESLLELVPRIELPERTFVLDTASGNERKTTGSYYTPPTLVSALLDTALDPLIDEAVKEARDADDAEARLLALTVCDPACGSGHFLVAAARRIARRLAEVASGEDDPAPSRVQHALREVVGRCIYGVDINDLAAELAKVSLWLEALEPGKPLGFLDARIRVGNSLLGATPALLHGGLPDGAFKDLEGDDKVFAAAIRKRNKEEARQGVLFVRDVSESNTELAHLRDAALAVVDDVDQVREQARQWQQTEESPSWLGPKIHADTWCAAFVWPLGDDDALTVPTNAVISTLASDPFDPTLKRTTDMAESLAREYRFFHWHLEFPEIFHVGDPKAVGTGPAGWSGGFSCVLGNPPWDHIELKEQEFFSSLAPDVAKAVGSQRKQLIESLPASDPVVYSHFTRAKRDIAALRLFASDSGLYPLTGRGRIKTDPLFAESGRHWLSPTGRLGMILPTGIATDATTQHFFRDLVERQQLVSLYDFENEDRVFSGVHHSYRFALLTLSRLPSQRVSLVFRVRQAADIAGRVFILAPEDILLLNPNTGTCPVFSSPRDAEITIGIYRTVPVFWREGAADGNPWGLSFMQGLFNMTSDSASFHSAEELKAAGWTLWHNVYQCAGERMLPLYEAKMAHQFDHRFSTYEGATQEQLNVGTLPRLDASAHVDPDRVPMPRYWVHDGLVEDALASDSERGRRGWPRDWLIGWRDIARSIDERTIIAAAVPRVGVGHTFPLAVPQCSTKGCAALLASLNSFCVDYAARQSLTGTHLTYTVVKQLPILAPQAYARDVPWGGEALDLEGWVALRVQELIYTAYDIEGFARDLGDDGAPFVWDGARRTTMRAELDAAYFHLYGVARADVDYIMDTFNVVRDRDLKAHGEYRTKRLILEIYDAMQKAIDTGVPYQTPLDPPPGHGRRHPNREGVR